MALYTDVLVWICPPARKFSPVLRTKRFAETELDDLPLKTLLALMSFKEKLFEVSRWPLAKMLWLPSPPLVPESFRKSALTPGLRIANWVKLPVPRGIACMTEEGRM